MTVVADSWWQKNRIESVLITSDQLICLFG